MNKIVSGKVQKTWEKTQANATAEISRAMGMPVVVGDDAFVYIIRGSGAQEKWEEVGAVVFVGYDPDVEGSGIWVFHPKSTYSNK